MSPEPKPAIHNLAKGRMDMNRGTQVRALMLTAAVAIASVAGAALEWAALTSEGTAHELKSDLATYRAPKIYGGTGQIVLYPPFSPEQLDEALENTKGMRLMGQRFVPDAYMMQELTFPRAGDFTGTGYMVRKRYQEEGGSSEYVGGGP